MRTRTIVVAGVLLAAMTAGCTPATGSDPSVATAQSAAPKADSSTAASAGPDPDASLKYAKCMREQGLDWFPDPKADGRMEVAVPQGVDRAVMDKAEKACRKLLPDGGERPQRSAEDIERNRQLAKCMRANGVPNFPDPGPEGEIGVDGNKLGTGPGDPAFDAAQKACAQYLPKDGVRSEKRTT
jgi:hypothetical protein